MRAKIFLLYCISLFVQSVQAELAVCVAPVADLLGDPLVGTASQIEHAYKKLPMESEGGQDAIALLKRLGQLVFNDVVMIVQEKDNQVRVRVPQQFYCTATDKAPHHYYWTLKKYLRPLGCIEDISGIPQPANDGTDLDKTVLLRRPFFDRVHNRWYSVGTRFVLNSHKTPHKDCFAVYTLAPRGLVQTIHIPVSLCVRNGKRTMRERRELFLDVLRDLVNVSDGIVPYVWGGSSFAVPYGYSFKKTIYSESPKIATYDAPHAYGDVHAGFDCSALVWRAAQIAGISLYARNSWALKYALRPLRAEERVQAGDILYIHGHIMIISDVEHARIIEARTPVHGYGFVQEIPLSEEFAGINSIQDLVCAHHAHTKVTRLDRDGRVITVLPVTILSLSTVLK